MPMMKVGHVRMFMRHGFMPVPMAVTTLRHRVMPVVVMIIFMRMGVLVLQSFVHMLVLVPLGQVNQHASKHEKAAHYQAPVA